MAQTVHKNMSLASALDFCRRNGARVWERTGTGEVMVSHPQLYNNRPCVINSRRKDSSQPLVVFCRKLEALVAATQGVRS